MKKIKVIACDIDNTLIVHGAKDVNEATLNGLKKIQEKGIEVVIATGRPWYTIQNKLAKELNLNYVVTINGACVVNSNHQTVIKTPIPEELCAKVIDSGNRHHVAMGFKHENCFAVVSQKERYCKTYFGNIIYPNLTLVDDCVHQNYYQTDLPLGIFVIGTEAEIAAMRQELPEFTFAYSFRNKEELGYDVFMNKVDKAYGLQGVLDELHVSWDEVMACGDALNDESMIRKAEIGVAMGNAVEELKQVADVVTDRCEENGVLKALVRFGLLSTEEVDL